MKVLVAGASARALSETAAAVVAAGHVLEVAASFAALRAAFAADVPPDGAIVAGPRAVDEVAGLRALLGNRSAWVAAWVDRTDAAWAALKAGADDVLVGPQPGAELALRMALGERALAQSRQTRRLQYLAKHPMLRDPRTGTVRPGVLEAQLEQALARVERTRQGVALLAIEAAPAGIPAQADLSPLVVARIAGAFRAGDTLAIDEDRSVLALLEGCVPDEAERVAQDVVDRLTRPPEGGMGVTFSVAAGVATQAPGEPRRDAAEVLDAAGSALARAWMGGRPVEVAGMGAAEARGRSGAAG